MVRLGFYSSILVLVACGLLSSMSSAQEKLSAPNVTKIQRLDAISHLEEAGFSFELKFVEDPCNLVDIVVEQFPLPGTQVSLGAEFTLSVNTAHGVMVPTLIGMQRSEAFDLAARVGLAATLVGDVVETHPSFSPSGRICEAWPTKRDYLSQIVRNQSPAAGSCAPLGTKVNVHLPVREEWRYIVVCDKCQCP